MTGEVASGSGGVQEELDRLAALLDDARAVLDGGVPDVPRGVALADATVIAGALRDAALGQLRASARGHPRTASICDLAVRAGDLDADLADAFGRHRQQLLLTASRTLERLQNVDAPSAFLRRVCPDLLPSTTFSRMILSKADGATWIPWAGAGRGGEEAWVTAGVRIGPEEHAIEGAVLGGAGATAVRDARGDRAASGTFVELSGTRSYVVAPVRVRERVVGLLHADRPGSRRAVDGTDRDVLAVLAEGVSRGYGRVATIAKLRRRRQRLQEAIRRAELGLGEAAAIAGASPATPDVGERALTFHEALTPREREILSRVVVGRSNLQIARELVIAEGTVKTHVKHILRKCGATNRSELIARGAEPRRPAG